VKLPEPQRTDPKSGLLDPHKGVRWTVSKTICSSELLQQYSRISLGTDFFFFFCCQ